MTPRLREMKCELSFLKNADGSCCFSQGSTCVWASCSGPGDVHASKSSEEAMVLDVSFRKNCGENKFNPINNIITKVLANVINLELFPHTTLVVTIHGVQNDGSIGSAALNGTCFALLDNGIPFENIFCGVTVAKVKGKLIVDPTLKEQTAAEASILFAVTRNQNEFEMCGMDSIGEFSFEEIEASWQLAKQSAESIFDFYRNVFKKKHSKDYSD